jgi:hypothetical protein
MCRCINDEVISLPSPVRYGNVAMLTAPPWSDASVQFVHGWPRKLCQHVRHGGVKRGNIIAASKASNSCLRRFALFDVATNVAAHVMEGVGLSLARLLSCR